MISFKPKTAIVKNQKIITGPKTLPTFAVPFLWKTKSEMRMIIVIGILVGMIGSASAVRKYLKV